jgi:hypothetical protein
VLPSSQVTSGQQFIDLIQQAYSVTNNTQIVGRRTAHIGHAKALTLLLQTTLLLPPYLSTAGASYTTPTADAEAGLVLVRSADPKCVDGTQTCRACISRCLPACLGSSRSLLDLANMGYVISRLSGQARINFTNVDLINL